MIAFSALIKRNVKLYFKDKGMFFTSLISPLILLLLFVTFLGNVYRDIFCNNIPEGMEIPKSVIEGFVGGWLFSSLLAVSCVTVAFCSNLLMVQDKVTGARGDLTMAPLKHQPLAFGYYLSTALSTLIVCLVTLGICFIYLSQVGWYLSFSDVLLIILDVILLVLFGTAFSSFVNFFLSTQGQMSAVGTIVSSAYGFICGAYMPISQFSPAIQKLISFLPGTYGTALLREHLMGGVLTELENSYMPHEIVSELRKAFDSDLYFFDKQVNAPVMYLILGGTTVLLVGIYAFLNTVKIRKKTKK